MRVSGYVIYSTDSYFADMGTENIGPPGTYTPIPVRPNAPIKGVPIVIVTEELADVEYACAVTDESGYYAFDNVPSSDTNTGLYYRVIEAFGCELATEETGSLVDFATEKQPLPSTMTIASRDPTMEYILHTGYVNEDGEEQKFQVDNANRIVSISSNVVKIYIKKDIIWRNTGSSGPPSIDVDTLNFKDAPQRCEPFIISDFLQFQNAILYGDNVVTVADGGTFGSLPEGTMQSTSYLNEPYSGISDFTWSKYGGQAPQGNKYSITNIAASGTFYNSWFDTPSYSTGDETGRFMVVNGDIQGQVFFRTNVQILPNTAYLFSCWAMNLMRFAESELPKFSIRIIDANSTTEEPTVLFYDLFNTDRPMEVTTIPTWRQIGTILTSDQLLNRTNLTIEFISEGPEAAGNDYAIDAVTVIALKRGVVAEKEVASPEGSVELNGEIEYVCTISNSNDNEDISHMMFKDLIQEGVVIKPDSFKISCSNIVDQPFTVEGFTGETTSVANAGIDIGKILAGLVQENDPYYVTLKMEKIPPGVTVVLKFKVVVKTVNNIEPYNVVKNRYRVQFLSELDAQNPDRPRTVASNEVVTPVIFTDLKTEKGIYEVDGETKTELPQGASVFPGTKVAYSITITNSGKAAANNIEIEDEFDELFLYELEVPEGECDVRVTKQIISPEDLAQQEQEVPCSDIERVGNNGLRISNISVPAANITEEATEEGVCVVWVYGKVKLQ